VVVAVTTCSTFALRASVNKSAAAQSKPTLEQLLGRLDAYLLEYETQLSSVVADERFEQSLWGFGAKALWRSATLESEVAFMRLPGGAEWLGFREVKRVNWKPVKPALTSITDVLSSSAGDLTKAREIAKASSRHNLGLPRTINVPTAPLEIIHPLHRGAHHYKLLADDSVRGTRTVVIGFEETGRPALLRDGRTGENLVSRGRVWLAPASGTVWRVEWLYEIEDRPVNSLTPKLRVEFEANKPLGIMVPTSMTENFAEQGGRGEGRAIYRNFRRFGTSARIVPQP
jgi:hypothetical protein